MTQTCISRRRFLAGTAIALTVLPLGGALLSPSARAQGLPKLPLDNPQAKALRYAETTDGLSHPSFKAGSDCANCQFFAAAAGSASGPCALFPGFAVSAKGWCSAWSKKA